MNTGLGNLFLLKTHLLGIAPGEDEVRFDDVIKDIGLGVAAQLENFCDRKFARVVGDQVIVSADRASFSLPRYPVEAVTLVEIQQDQDISTAWHALLTALGIEEVGEHAAKEAAKNTITIIAGGQRIIIRTGEAAHDAAMTGVEVGTHVAGEGAKTGATGTHSLLRMAWNWLETQAHNLGVALRVMFHLGGETTATSATVAGATTRVAANAAVAGAGAASAEASIPYVGPILAIVAMGAVMAAVMALMGGFEAGDFTGGQEGKPAGIVHGQEFVFSAPRVRQLGVPFLRALHNGSLADMVAPRAMSAMASQSGGGNGAQQAPVQNHKIIIVHDAKQAALEAMASPAGEKIHIAHTNKNRNKVGIST